MKPRPIIMPVESPERRAERTQRIAAYLSKLDGAKAWQLLVEPWKKERTGRQNNALWGPAYETLSAFTGYTQDELHDVFCRAFFGEVEYEVMGVWRTKPRRTTTKNEQGERDVINRERMSEFFALVQQKAAEIGCYIEDPDPQLRTRAA